MRDQIKNKIQLKRVKKIIIKKIRIKFDIKKKPNDEGKN